MEGMLSALHTGPQAGGWEGTKDTAKNQEQAPLQRFSDALRHLKGTH